MPAAVASFSKLFVYRRKILLRAQNIRNKYFSWHAAGYGMPIVGAEEEGVAQR